MKNLYIIIILSILPITGFSQLPDKSGITGIITDINGQEPLEFATVSVYTPDSALVTGNITGPDGTFKIALIPGLYFAKIQFVSYEEKFTNIFSIPFGESPINLGTIALEPRTVLISEAVITGEKSEMVIALDKKVFNVGKDLSNTGKSTLEILDNVPSVSVDLDGNISMRGSESLQILVDGKPSGLINNGNSNALQSLPGNLIERIEVITNPSARYEAEGMAGIINIVLKKEERYGVNGSFEGSAGYPHDYSLSTNINFRREKINYFINYGLSYDERPGDGSAFQHFMFEDTTYYTRMHRSRLRTGWSHTLRGGADYFINSRNVITASVMVGIEDQLNLTDILYKDYDANEILSDNTLREDREKETERNIEFALNYEKKFEKKDHKFNALFQYIEDSELEKSNISERQIDYSGENIDENPLFQKSYNKEFERKILFKADYIYPLSEKLKFETGYRSEFRKITNPYIVEEIDSDDNWIKLSDFSNNFDYTENVHALYIQTGNKFGKYSLQLGLRAELSDIHTYLENTREQNDRLYFNIFPTIHNSFQFDQKNSFQLSYSRRINRPHFWLLNPFYSFSDSRNFRSGNPNLNPEYTDSYEGGYLFNNGKFSFYGGLYYKNTEGVIERINFVDTTGITIQKPLNLSKQKSYGIESNISLDVVKWWTLSGDINFYRAITTGEYAGENLSSDTYSWNTRLNSKLKFRNNLDFQAIFFYRAPQRTTQGIRKEFYMLNLAASKDVLGGDGTLTLNIRDVLNSRKFRYILERPELYSENEFRWSTRSISLTFIYRLNQKKKINGNGNRGNGAGGGDIEF
ncbi:MAG: TonB-dependent receptor [Bacteroidales bacterium]|nr:TonB-dependent receptor [Bacteroidales bacterium]